MAVLEVVAEEASVARDTAVARDEAVGVELGVGRDQKVGDDAALPPSPRKVLGEGAAGQRSTLS